MNKAWWWVVAIFGIGGLSCIGNEMTNLGVFFILCAIGVGAAIIIVGAIANRKQNEETQADEQRLRSKGFPITYSFDLGHFTGAYEYEKWHAGYPDSAGGWDVWGGVKNISPYVINYINLYVYPVDRIGSRVAKTETWKYTGPFEQGQMKLIRSEHNWYDLSVDSVEAEKIVVDYHGGATQITTGVLSAFAQYGHRTADKIWIKERPSSEKTWDIQAEVWYESAKPANKIVFYIVPLNSTGVMIDSPSVLAYAGSFQKGHRSTVWWYAEWKSKPVASVKIQKFRIEFTDGTTQIVEF